MGVTGVTGAEEAQRPTSSKQGGRFSDSGAGDRMLLLDVRMWVTALALPTILPKRCGVRSGQMRFVPEFRRLAFLNAQFRTFAMGYMWTRDRQRVMMKSEKRP